MQLGKAWPPGLAQFCPGALLSVPLGQGLQLSQHGGGPGAQQGCVQTWLLQCDNLNEQSKVWGGHSGYGWSCAVKPPAHLQAWQ